MTILHGTAQLIKSLLFCNLSNGIRNLNDWYKKSLKCLTLWQVQPDKKILYWPSVEDGRSSSSALSNLGIAWISVAWGVVCLLCDRLALTRQVISSEMKSSTNHSNFGIAIISSSIRVISVAAYLMTRTENLSYFNRKKRLHESINMGWAVYFIESWQNTKMGRYLAYIHFVWGMQFNF